MSAPRRALLFVGAIVAVAIVVALVVHLTLALFTLRVAVASVRGDGLRIAAALSHLFATQDRRLRLRLLPEADLPAAAAALDAGRSELAIVRSDAAGQSGQTVVVTRRDAVMFASRPDSGVARIDQMAGRSVGIVAGRRIDAQLLDTVLRHYGIAPDAVRRSFVDPGRVPEVVTHGAVDVLFVVAPVDSDIWLTVLSPLRKAAGAEPRLLEVGEAAAIAKAAPVLETIDLPRGSLRGANAAPSDDVTTLSVSYRLVAAPTMPDWMAGEITRQVLAGKLTLASLDPGLVDIAAPDTDDKGQGLPVHPGTLAYLNGTLVTLSDRIQNALYWLGLLASGAVSLGAAAFAFYQRLRPAQPTTRIMRLLEIWIAIRDADRDEIATLELEADGIVAETVRDALHKRTARTEMDEAVLLASNIRSAVERRWRAKPSGPGAKGVTELGRSST